MSPAAIDRYVRDCYNLFMIRVVQIVSALDLEHKALRQCRRSCILHISLLTSLCLFLLGCSKTAEEPIWEKVKLGDLAPEGGDLSGAELVKAVNLEIRVIEVPVDNIGKLDGIRKQLRIRPLRLTSFKAFDANSFLARFGRGNLWNEVGDVLSAANATEVVKVSLLLPDGEPQTLTVTGLRSNRSVFYTAADGSRQAAKIGPGIIALRIKADKIPGRRGVCEVVAYPVFTVPIKNTIRQLDSQMRRREFPFTSAAFGLTMSPGDFVYLGPKQFVSDQTDLGGLGFVGGR